MRSFLVAGNWKMNGSKPQATELLQQLVPLLKDITHVECVVCPPNVYLPLCSELLEASNIKLGAQNIASNIKAAYTGEISPPMLREFACKYVIIGHSERRTLLQETDQLIAEKVAVALDGGLHPILCIGETKEQLDAGLGLKTVMAQLAAVLEKVGIERFKNAVVAYEPVWAIGTGLSATPQQAQEMHAHIRKYLAVLDPEIAATTQILYGGSMNAANAAELLQQPDINGGLIGGASLKAQEFSEICHAAMRIGSK